MLWVFWSGVEVYIKHKELKDYGKSLKTILEWLLPSVVCTQKRQVNWIICCCAENIASNSYQKPTGVFIWTRIEYKRIRDQKANEWDTEYWEVRKKMRIVLGYFLYFVYLASRNHLVFFRYCVWVCVGWMVNDWRKQYSRIMYLIRSIYFFFGFFIGIWAWTFFIHILLLLPPGHSTWFWREMSLSFCGLLIYFFKFFFSLS